LGLVVGCGKEDRPPETLPSDDTPVGSTTTPCVDTFEALSPPVRDGEDPGRPDPMETVLPTLLSGTLLYQDIQAKLVHPAVQLFTPAFELWSDGADKRRWVYLPECETVDSSTMDDWSLPVGATLFKEFSVDGNRIETRILVRLGPGPRQFALASYLWNEDESDATLVGPEGLEDARGTSHDIPSKAACLRCHGTYQTGGGRPSRALGFSALQLAHSGEGLTLDALVADGQLSHAPGPIAVPGDAVEQAALGYLHANCGNCHNSTADRVPQVDLDLWLEVDVTDVASTSAWRTTVDLPSTLFNDQHVSGRVVPGDPEQSAVWYRMNARGTLAQMPPLASEVPDPAGLAAVRAWIEALP